MESSSGTPHLLTDVRFTVSRKGYDPDEVDNFLERVSAAVAQLQEKLRRATADAEAAEGRAAEATRTQTLLQAKIDKLQGDLDTARTAQPAPAASVARSADDDAAEMSKVLVLAQRTADAAVAEARATASQLVNDAEQEAARIRATAQTEAEEESTRRRAALAEEVRSLEAERSALSGDISSLDGYLSEQRSSLGGALDRIRAVLDDPQSLRLAPAPATSATAAAPATAGATAGDGDVRAEEPHGGPSAGSPDPAEQRWSPSAGTTPDEASSDESSSDESTSEGPASDAATDSVGSSAAAPPDATEATDVRLDRDEPGTADTDEPWSPRPQPGTSDAPTASVGDEAPTSATAGADAPGRSESLFGGEGHTGAEPVSADAPRAEAGEGEGGFGQGDEEADAAMRRFFEADFGDDQRFSR